jgi:HK97 family phage prohead protease
MEADFSGYATKAGLKCSDGRTITAEAFKHQDKMTVPLVWQHGHNDPNNVLGHMELEARVDGVYGYGYFNDTPQGLNAKKLVEHKDVNRLSIYANELVEKAKVVLHGAIREVSLVLSGANPGAQIDYVRLAHTDGSIEELEDEAIILTGLELEHEAKPEDPRTRLFSRISTMARRSSIRLPIRRRRRSTTA